MAERLKDFQTTLTEAVSDLAEHGYDSAERVARWTRELRDAAERSLISPESLALMQHISTILQFGAAHNHVHNQGCYDSLRRGDHEDAYPFATQFAKAADAAAAGENPD
jgi:hypothetical protein